MALFWYFGCTAVENAQKGMFFFCGSVRSPHRTTKPSRGQLRVVGLKATTRFCPCKWRGSKVINEAKNQSSPAGVQLAFLAQRSCLQVMLPIRMAVKPPFRAFLATDIPAHHIVVLELSHVRSGVESGVAAGRGEGCQLAFFEN